MLFVPIAVLALLSCLPLRRTGSVGDESFKSLAELAESSSREQRRSAVRRLAKLETDEAWGLVVRALGDVEGLVADEAEWRLAKASGDSVIELLQGRLGLKADDPWTATGAARALGRVAGELDAERLSKSLKTRDKELCAALLGALEARARSGSLTGRRERILKQVQAVRRTAREPWLQASALVTAAVASETEDQRADMRRDVLRAAKEREPSLRIGALIAAQELGDALVLELLQKLSRDEALCVRLQVFESAMELANRAAAEVLVASLESETHVRARWRVVQALQQISGLLHRADPRPWRDWLSKLEDDWRGSVASSIRTRSVSHAQSGASLAGLPILSDRIIFLVDFSGSLWTKRADGTVRKDYADAELRKALEALPDTARFNLIPYTAEPHPWRSSLVRATPRNVKEAIEWFEECSERGSGDFYEAAQLALMDPEVDTILSFTDGLPTGGRLCRLELMVPSLLERARFRRIAFDTLLVDAPSRLHRHWERLARESGGLLHAVDAR